MMNKLKYVLFAVIISLFVVPYVKADSISIKSIDLTEKSETTIINSEPTFSGLEMNYDLTFKNVNDYAMYRIVIENNTNKEYKVTENTAFKVSEYVTYFYTKDQVINANSTTDISITIKYTKQIDENLIPEGEETFKETNQAILELKDENDVPVENPKTGIAKPLIWLLTLLVVSSIGVFLIKKREVTLVIITLILLIPGILHAIEELKLVINVNVEIQKPDPVTPPVVQKYKVSYVLENVNGYFTDEEISKQAPENIACYDTYHIGVEAAAANYTSCHGSFIFVDENEYEPGQTVTIKEYNIKDIENCILPRSLVNECPEGIITNNPIDQWEYSRNFVGEHINPSKINASSITYDYWDTSGSMYVNPNGTFTMPEHDVIFYYTPLKNKSR